MHGLRMLRSLSHVLYDRRRLAWKILPVIYANRKTRNLKRKSAKRQLRVSDVQYETPQPKWANIQAKYRPQTQCAAQTTQITNSIHPGREQRGEHIFKRTKLYPKIVRIFAKSYQQDAETDTIKQTYTKQEILLFLNK